MSDAVSLSRLRPTQLYLNAEKLAAVLERVGPDGLEYDPLPVYAFESDGSLESDDLYLTDGHTRAFVAYLTGADELRVTYDEDLPEKHDVAVYRECIEWCEDADVRHVSDLSGRVLGPDAYERTWIERCRRAAERLDDA